MLPKRCRVCDSEMLDDNPRKFYCSDGCRQWFSNRKAAYRQRNTNICVSLKLQLIKAFGDGCQLCGYRKNLAGLAFHHIDPATKLFTLGMDSIYNRNWDSLIAEAKKCQLLCHNCHAEQHHPRFDLALLSEEDLNF